MRSFPGQGVTLTALQRAKIVGAILRDKGAAAPSGQARSLREPNRPGDSSVQSLPEPAAADVVLGAAVPEMLPLTPLPDSIGVEIPAVRNLSYVVVGGRLLLVDPMTNIAVAEINR